MAPGGDRISDLSDEILVDILSRLPLTDEAVRTSVLSKRWKPVWTHLERLSFRISVDRVNGGGKPCPSLESLALCLARHDAPKLTHLSIAVNNPLILYEVQAEFFEPRPPFEGHVELLLGFAKRKSVEILSVDYFVNGLDFDDDYPARSYCRDVVPYCFQQIAFSSSVRELKTFACSFELFAGGTTNWTSLRALDVGCSDLSGSLLVDLLAGCAVLESLRLHLCKVDRVEITSKRLKKVVIEEIWDGDAKSELRITAPFIEHLELVGAFSKDTTYKLIDVSSLLVANIDLHYDLLWYPSDEEPIPGLTAVVELLKKLRHVQELRMGPWCTQALSAWKFGEKVVPALSCKRLILGLYGSDYCAYPAVESLLRSSPMVEKLVFNFTNCIDPDIEVFFERQRSDDSAIYWRKPLAEIDCLTHHLKAIHVHGIRDDSLLNLDILEFLLRSAKVLEEMVVHDIVPSENPDKHKFFKKLLDSPIASPTAAVHLPSDVVKKYGSFVVTVRARNGGIWAVSSKWLSLDIAPLNQ